MMSTSRFTVLKAPIARLGAVLALVAGLAWSQSNVGEISGQVSDATGAAVPDCAVTATHTHTGFRRTILTQENGIYVFAALPEGRYNVVAEKQGFRASEQTGVVLDAATRRNIDFRMEVGAVTESVSVSAAVEQVQTASRDATRVISDRQLSQEPGHQRRSMRRPQRARSPGAISIMMAATNC
jgi:hypothetical protein